VAGNYYSPGELEYIHSNCWQWTILLSPQAFRWEAKSRVALEAKEVLIREIEQLERDLRARRAALMAFNREDIDRGDAKQKYIGMRPLDATVQILEDQGPIPMGEILRALRDGGNLNGKRKGAAEFSIRRSLQLGHLVKLTGRKNADPQLDDVIGLPKQK
jgi:hypothetical protein